MKNDVVTTNKVKPALQLLRAHTAPLEAVPAAVGALLVVQELNWVVWMWAGIGALYHFTGYGMNSYMDWLNGYDKNDEYKQHHPLNVGTLQPNTARVIVFALFLILMSLLVTVSIARSYVLYGSFYRGTVVLIIVFIGIACGMYYNAKGKSTTLKPLPIAISHTTVFVVPYLIEGGSPTDLIFILGVMYMFSWIFFQIGISGDILGLNQDDEENVVRSLGGVMNNSSYPGVEKSFYAVGTSLPMVSFLLVAYRGIIGAFLTQGDTSYYFLQAFVFLSLLYSSYKIIEPGMFDRRMRMKWVSASEFLSLAFFCSSFLMVNSSKSMEYAAAILVCLSTLWVFTMNRFMWGTWLSPRV